MPKASRTTAPETIGAGLRVALSTRFACSLEDGYDYITDLGNWPAYWPNAVRLAPGSRWSQRGDTARLTVHVLGRPRELVMTLSRIIPYRLIEYTSLQHGLPAASHQRRFAADGRGFDYRIVVDLEQRAGLRRPFDRLVVPHAVERMARQTFNNLERSFAERSAPGAARTRRTW